MLKGTYISLTTSCGFCLLSTTEVVSKIFTNLNIVAHLVAPAGWGSCLPKLAIFDILFCTGCVVNFVV